MQTHPHGSSCTVDNVSAAVRRPLLRAENRKTDRSGQGRFPSTAGGPLYSTPIDLVGTHRGSVQGNPGAGHLVTPTGGKRLLRRIVNKMKRKLALLVTLLATALLGRALLGVSASAGDPPALSSGGVSTKLDLKGQLSRGLRARRPVEFQYIDSVVAMVDSGTLPRSLVDSTFIYARQQNTQQLQHFQFALQSRAKKIGITTPDLKSQIVIRR